MKLRHSTTVLTNTMAAEGTTYVMLTSSPSMVIVGTVSAMVSETMYTEAAMYLPKFVEEKS